MHFNFAMLKSGLGLATQAMFEVWPSQRVTLRLPSCVFGFEMAESDIRLAIQAMEVSRL